MPSRLLLGLSLAAATALPAGLAGTVPPGAGTAPAVTVQAVAAAGGVTAGSLETALGTAAGSTASAEPDGSVTTADDPGADAQATVEQTGLVVVALAQTASAEELATGAGRAPDGTSARSSSGTDEITAEDLPTVDPSAQTVVAEVVGADEPERVLTAPVDLDGAQTVGITWPAASAGTELDAQVRSLTDGTWGDWVELGSSDVAPDDGTADAENAVRGGTDSLWVGGAEAVQLSFAASVEGGPEDMSLALVSSPEVDAAQATDGGQVEGASASGDGIVRSAAYVVPATVSAPRVYSRAEWGARAQACQPDVASTLLAAVVHHTAGSNSYTTVAQAMQQIRNDQAYHIDGRGWCDIGYNFLVDKWGNVYEGRANSGTQPVIGVHAGGFNTATVGISMLGDYSTVTPSTQTQESVAQVIAWRLSQYHRDPTSTVGYTTWGGENSRYAAGTRLDLRVVVGHRDTAYTACPGNAGYATLDGVRARARAIIGAGFVNPAPSSTSIGIGGSVSITGGVITGASWTLAVTDTRTNLVVRQLTGSSGSSGGGAIASWDGRSSAGNSVGPGTYRLTLSGTYGATTLVPYSVNVTVSGSQNPPTVSPVALTGDLGFVTM